MYTGWYNSSLGILLCLASITFLVFPSPCYRTNIVPPNTTVASPLPALVMGYYGPALTLILGYALGYASVSVTISYIFSMLTLTILLLIASLTLSMSSSAGILLMYTLSPSIYFST